MDLTLERVTLTYPDGDSVLTAVDDVTLTVPSGTTTALLGPSGAGKSSLLALAAGLTQPTAGRVLLAGQEVLTPTTTTAKAARLRLDRLGIVFQQPQLLASLTVLEQLELQAHLRGQRRSAMRQQARELLAAVGLAGLEQRRPAQLSGGQRQRVAIARAMVGTPAVLLVDEPTAALDHDRGVAVVELITTLARRLDAACLLVTHDAATLDSVDTRVEMRDGALLAGQQAAV